MPLVLLASMRTKLIAIALGLLQLSPQVLGSRWPDCSSDVSGPGVFGVAPLLNFSFEDRPVFVVHPSLFDRAPYPVIIFSHGSTGEFAMYQSAIERYVSHGFVVIFPHIKGIKEDIEQFTTDPMGGFTTRGLDYAKTANSDASSALHRMLDLEHVVLVGHSMGASSTIMAASKLPAGSVKLAIAQHPGICGPFGPPPCIGPVCSTWMPADFQKALSNVTMMLTTATNDAAFWPEPETAKHELGCFHKSTDYSLSKAESIFAQFTAKACADDGTGGRVGRKWSTGGHNCPMQHVSVETQWVLVAAKLYVQLDNNPRSTCYAMLWGSDPGSLSGCESIERLVLNPHNHSFAVVV